MKIAVLGCGSIGRRHLQNLRQLNQTDLMVFDPIQATRESISQELGVSCYADLKDVWSQKPHVALITAPTNSHVELALESALHNCHLFIEKPLSHSLAGIETICAESERRALVTMVGCNMRFHHGPATIKRLIAERAVGNVLSIRLQTGSYLPRWRPTQNYKDSYSASPEWGGAILDCIHELDLALWYSGPATVLCASKLQATAIGLVTDGLAEILLRHHSSILSSIHLNFMQRDYRRTCQVIGTEGTIYWDFEKRCVEIYGPDGDLTLTIQEPAEFHVNHMYLDELSHFLKCVEANIPTFNSISNAILPLKIALEARSYEHD